MPEIKGFRAWRYNKEKVKRFSEVLAPPYDVISKKEQEELHRGSAHNVVRLILGKEARGDSTGNNKYTRAGEFFENWRSSKVLFQDASPAIYVYVQDYKENRKPQRRIGFIAAMKLDERAVLRHENTLAAPKEDRMALIKEVRANLSPIFGLFEDKSGVVQKILNRIVGAGLPAGQAGSLRPAIDAAIEGVRHRLFVEQRSDVLAAIVKAMRLKPVFIADGHHRFEVACQYKKWMKSQVKLSGRWSATKASADQSANVPLADWNYVMTYFSDCLHNPFTIYPTHRLIRVKKNAGAPLELLKQKGALKKFKTLPNILHDLSKTRLADPNKNYRFGVYTKKDGFSILTLDKKRAPSKSAKISDRLDVAMLHRAIIEKPEAIDFTRDAAAAVKEVKKGKFDLAIFLRPTSLKEVVDVSKKGLKMPQKSTYFYPKLLSGLVFHRFE